MTGITTIHASELRTGVETALRLGRFDVRLVRRDADASDVRRIHIETGDGYFLELLPSKGLSVGRFATPSGDLFWKIPVEGLISPEKLDLLAPMLVEGESVEALRWIENFAGAIELLGLSNWGMPYRPVGSTSPLPLHGEASQIPVDYCELHGGEQTLTARSSFDVYDRWWEATKDDPRPWYLRGVRQWRVVRQVTLDTEGRRLQVVDTITNEGDEPRRPDWGYHVQLRPEDGARFIVPCDSVVSRTGQEVPDDFQVWKAARDERVREERGYIHTGCTTKADTHGRRSVECTAKYPTAPDVTVTIPYAPYIQSWFSCGGKGGRSFDLPERPDGTFMKVGWDGFGPEFGASPLDHDGACNPEVVEPVLAPGQARQLVVELRQKRSEW